MSDAARVAAVREALLGVHRALVAAERADVERRTGRQSNAAFLQALANDLRHAWLLPLAELIVRIDEAMDAASKEGRTLDEDEATELADSVRALLAPPVEGTPFGNRYVDALQRDPALVLAHGALVGTLR